MNIKRRCVCLQLKLLIKHARSRHRIRRSASQMQYTAVLQLHRLWHRLWHRTIRISITTCMHRSVHTRLLIITMNNTNITIRISKLIAIAIIITIIIIIIIIRTHTRTSCLCSNGCQDSLSILCGGSTIASLVLQKVSILRTKLSLPSSSLLLLLLLLLAAIVVVVVIVIVWWWWWWLWKRSLSTCSPRFGGVCGASRCTCRRRRRSVCNPLCSTWVWRLLLLLLLFILVVCITTRLFVLLLLFLCLCLCLCSIFCGCPVVIELVLSSSSSCSSVFAFE